MVITVGLLVAALIGIYLINIHCIFVDPEDHPYNRYR
ncbi:hypothetical protein LCGC14_1094260 [marine sediment metagenome]|uniref:Uncharacterized protein n=1 Tax=marine sediment metagenome TaxID=412755 RepID=A0A0F9MBM0_9ZZZZ